jgi:hypothetical protein
VGVISPSVGYFDPVTEEAFVSGDVFGDGLVDVGLGGDGAGEGQEERN